jgi:hypothetical protein
MIMFIELEQTELVAVSSDSDIRVHLQRFSETGSQASTSIIMFFSSYSFIEDPFDDFFATFMFIVSILGLF